MEFHEVSLAEKEDSYVLLNWTDMTQVRQKNLNKIIKSFELNKKKADMTNRKLRFFCHHNHLS